MHKLFATLLATLGFASAVKADSPIQYADPKTIRFTTPTLSMDELEYIVPTKQSFEGAPQFHEDEWRQVEFYPATHLTELQRQLVEYKAFEAKNRTQYGWNNVYSRKPSKLSVVPAGTPIDSLAKVVEAQIAPGPILTTTSRPLGQVKNAFTLHLTGGVFLYGVQAKGALNALAVLVEQGGDDRQVVNAFLRLNKAYGLVLVDWRAQQVLVSSTSTGEINVWRP